MNDNIVDEVKLEKQIKHAFGIDLEIKQFITHNMPVSSDGIGSIFITPKHQLFLYMTFHSKVKLGDVSKVVKKLNLLVERYLPPRGKNDYFNEIAREKFVNKYENSFMLSRLIFRGKDVNEHLKKLVEENAVHEELYEEILNDSYEMG